MEVNQCKYKYSSNNFIIKDNANYISYIDNSNSIGNIFITEYKYTIFALVSVFVFTQYTLLIDIIMLKSIYTHVVRVAYRNELLT